MQLLIFTQIALKFQLHQERASLVCTVASRRNTYNSRISHCILTMVAMPGVAITDAGDGKALPTRMLLTGRSAEQSAATRIFSQPVTYEIGESGRRHVVHWSIIRSTYQSIYPVKIYPYQPINQLPTIVDPRNILFSDEPAIQLSTFQTRQVVSLRSCSTKQSSTQPNTGTLTPPTPSTSKGMRDQWSK